MNDNKRTPTETPQPDDIQTPETDDFENAVQEGQS